MRRLLAVLLLVGCGSNDAKPDAAQADAAVDATPDAAPVPPLGDVMPVAGGGSAVIAAPKLVLITANNDALQADYETFAAQYAASAAWTSQVSEYGIGAFTATTKRLATAPATDQAAIDLITANTTGATPAWGATDPSTVYMFVIPKGAAFDDGTGSKCCTDYFGYHYDAMVGSTDAAYSIVCGCDDSTYPNFSTLQVTTSTASHEMVEAASDPRLDPPGYGTVDDDHYGWSYGTDPELADLCQYADTAYWVGAPGVDSKYALQRTWSNAAAHAGHDPCVGQPATPYYQTVPAAPDAFTLTIDSSPVNTHGNKIAVGATGTITLHVYADDASGGPLTVTLDDLGMGLLDFTQPTGTFLPGDTIHVTVHVKGTDQLLDNKAEVFEVATKSATGPKTYFYSLIGQ
jgi:hypothetical protein